MTQDADVFNRNSFCRRTAAAVMITAVATIPGLLQAADAFRISDSGNIGIGIDTPVRQLHLQGPNATFRMDRNIDSSAFILVRTAAANFNDIWKGFVVGVNASARNNGELIINDLGSAVSGAGSRRMTIKTNGDVNFPRNLTALSINATSSIRYKTDVETITEANRSLDKLRGVRFKWKENGLPSIGLIAEEVAQVFPEVVQRNVENGEVDAINYAALTGVLVEALKEQQAQLTAQQKELAAYKVAAATNQARVSKLESRVAKFETLQARLTDLEGRLGPIQLQLTENQKP
ncbi:tail fiber domain-containing protein [uncultured Lamprocystis sp.]|jgi:hypothetical protein|uniref:tail fiber domain-containing protein n=2 Tax=uncultured Lamprocystis sp. TaxID=543132 RepID=UPI0025E5501E|nr:tail fiber domain-containing protein [uncultured Lamprocystis sp.]